MLKNVLTQNKLKWTLISQHNFNLKKRLERMKKTSILKSINVLIKRIAPKANPNNLRRTKLNKRPHLRREQHNTSLKYLKEDRVH
jgi:hypothetical protein